MTDIDELRKLEAAANAVSDYSAYNEQRVLYRDALESAAPSLIAEIESLRKRLDAAEGEIDEVNDALSAAVIRARTAERACARKDAALKDMMAAVKVFHGPIAWDIYEKNAPEMQRARSALSTEGR